MNRSEFLKNFEKHLRKYGHHWSPDQIIQNLYCKCCPLLITEDWTKLWEKQTQYYTIQKLSGRLTDQMISIVKKFYKMS